MWKSYTCRTVVSQIVTGYLPSLILHLVAALVPPIMKLFSAMQGYIALSEIERSACNKMLLFTIWFLFFANVLTGSVTSQIQLLFDPKTIPLILAVSVPAQVKALQLSWKHSCLSTHVYARLECSHYRKIVIIVP